MILPAPGTHRRKIMDGLNAGLTTSAEFSDVLDKGATEVCRIIRKLASSGLVWRTDGRTGPGAPAATYGLTDAAKTLMARRRAA